VPVETRFVLVAAVILVVIAAGLFWKSRTGRAQRVAGGQLIDLAKLGATKNGQPVTAFGERMTFLQFSTEFCSQCVQTARVYKELEEHSEGIQHSANPNNPGLGCRRSRYLANRRCHQGKDNQR
jgi:hypothetical protein